MVDAAVELGQRGFRVHPCRPEDKRPLTRWLEAATTDAYEIRSMWRRWPDALIAVRTGDGLVVVDDDRGLAEPDPSLDGTLVASTSRPGGWHYYFTSDVPVANSVGKVAPGIDIRGEHGYVIAPPSQGRAWVTHPWLDELPIMPLPAALLIAIQKTEETQRRSRFEPRDHVPAGERHDYLLRFAGWLVANGLAIDYGTLTHELLDHAAQVCEPPESERSRRTHVEGIARWVLTREFGRG